MKRAVLFVFLAVLLAFAGTGLLQALSPDDRTPGAGQFGPNPRDLIDPPGLPRPIDPAPQTAQAGSDSYQLVGFTSKVYRGDEGILNFALACRAEFGGGRMCSNDEIDRTLHVPTAPGTGYAWIQRSGADNCKGWMSEAAADVGVAIDLGRCYGGQTDQTCNSLLRVACCAPLR